MFESLVVKYFSILVYSEPRRLPSCEKQARKVLTGMITWFLGDQGPVHTARYFDPALSLLGLSFTCVCAGPPHSTCIFANRNLPSARVVPTKRSCLNVLTFFSFIIIFFYSWLVVTHPADPASLAQPEPSETGEFNSVGHFSRTCKRWVTAEMGVRPCVRTPPQMCAQLLPPPFSFPVPSLVV